MNIFDPLGDLGTDVVFTGASLAMLVLGGGSMGQVPLSRFEHPGRPTLLMVGCGSAFDLEVVKFRALLLEDELLDRGVVGCEVREDAPDGAALGAWLRGRMKLGSSSPVWGLLARDGRLLKAGGPIPDFIELAGVLDHAGERNPVRVLEAFLKKHPEHAEARRDLLLALRPRLMARLQEIPLPLCQNLSPTQDQRVWGAMVQVLERLFQDDAWVGLEFNLNALLPHDGPERVSPLMKQFYKRRRPQVVAVLRRYPELAAAWNNLLRIETALGEGDLLSVMETIAWWEVRPVEVSLLPCRALAQGILAQVRRQEGRKDWCRAKAALQLIWGRLVKPKLACCGKGDFELDPQEAERWNGQERMEFWIQVLEPLIEAMVRSGSAAEVPLLLGQLDASWILPELKGRVLRLAQALGQPKLGDLWSAAMQNLPPRIQPAGVPNFDLIVIHQSQRGMDDFAKTEYQRAFARSGMVGLGLEVASPSWVNRLGWRQGLQRWVLVDLSGQVLLQGEILPSAGELRTAYLGLGRSTPLERVTVFRMEHPDQVGAWVAELRIRAAMAMAEQSERKTSRIPEKGWVWMNEPEKEAWITYVRLLVGFLELPLGVCPGPLRQAEIDLPSPEYLGEQAQAMGIPSMAHQGLLRLEAELARRPSDAYLWQAWQALAPHAGRSLLQVLEPLAPSPAAPSGGWPPRIVLSRIAECLYRDQRWQDVVELLLPRWQARLPEAIERPGEKRFGLPGEPGPFGGWNWDLSRFLLEALLRLGRVHEADKIMAALPTMGEGPTSSELEALCQTAKGCGEASWAQRWTPASPHGSRRGK